MNKLAEIDWFSNLGRTEDSSLEKISSWDDWPGPEDTYVAQLNDDLLEIWESLDFAGDNESDWDSVIKRTVNSLRQFTPYDENEDAYYGPNHAVWQAAWVANLIEKFEHLGIDPPKKLTAQMHWFVSGHWPCSYIQDSSGNEITDYVVF